MEKIKFIIMALIFAFPQLIFGQSENKKQIERHHMISTTFAFTPSVFFNEDLSLYYLHGSLSYYPTPKISIRGDSSFSFREFNNEGNIDIRYHSTFFGACYHFTENGALDPFIGLQPGYSFLERSYVTILPFENSIQEFLPNASVVAGLNFYVNRFFNIYANVRYVYGQPARNFTQGSGLHEIRFAFGLGANLAKWQKKN